MAFVTRPYGLTISRSADLLESIASCIYVEEDALMMSVFKEEWRDRLETTVSQITAGYNPGLQNMFSKCSTIPTLTEGLLKRWRESMFFWNVKCANRYCEQQYYMRQCWCTSWVLRSSFNCVGPLLILGLVCFLSVLWPLSLLVYVF